LSNRIQRLSRTSCERLLFLDSAGNSERLRRIASAAGVSPFPNKLILGRDVKSAVCATNAGREGELIFRFLYEAAGCRKPVRRLWISSLTPSAIKSGLLAMKDGSAYDSLAAAVGGRAQADWLVGMNLSRANKIAPHLSKATTVNARAASDHL
jgi:hypothetical protein